jgi:hypothetical protein
VKPCSGSGRKVWRQAPNISGREQNILKKHAVCANEASLINQSLLSAIVSIEHPLKFRCSILHQSNIALSTILKPLPSSAAVSVANVVLVSHQCVSELFGIL